MSAVVQEPTHMDLGSPATLQLEFWVLNPQLERAGSLNPLLVSGA